MQIARRRKKDDKVIANCYDITELIGNTPLLWLNKVNKRSAFLAVALFQPAADGPCGYQAFAGVNRLLAVFISEVRSKS